MAEDLCDHLGKFCSWSRAVGISYHKAIFLQLDFDSGPKFYLFKFNYGWLSKESFCCWIRETWQELSQNPHFSPLLNLPHKLQKLKGLVRTWVKDKKEEELKLLTQIEDKLHHISVSLELSRATEV